MYAIPKQPLLFFIRAARFNNVDFRREHHDVVLKTDFNETFNLFSFIKIHGNNIITNQIRLMHS